MDRKEILRRIKENENSTNGENWRRPNMNCLTSNNNLKNSLQGKFAALRISNHHVTDPKMQLAAKDKQVNERQRKVTESKQRVTHLKKQLTEIVLQATDLIKGS